ncbi:MAG: hypothetical protein AUJ85_06065 [Elusimicrobia bacterium CG1_02_37_114]|nr:MAG: hypothetical protein AUJ85_06065 [Elusimicrobia bacterium CG1_02_37_114]PIV52756.1 MAG: hypothetical protein COS17_07385 [Elusimicrobia bacterium CG02_land_8_20_14_3_00_37_13]PIZ12674.1 MAG: hypothetical protein COY53_08715 [Elusimicrobia bacterium CG_4_10_14_0_8_um_filter_37_32]
MKTNQRLFEYLKIYSKRFILAIICMMGVSALNGLSRLLIKPLIDKVFIAKDGKMLYWIIIAVPAIYLLLGLLNYAKNYLMSYIGQRISIKLRIDAYEHLQKLSIGFYSKNATGQIVSRLTNDISAIQTALNKVPATCVCDGLTVIVLIGVLFYLRWDYALIGLVFFPLASIPIIKFSQRLRSFSRHGQKQMAYIYDNLQDSLSGIRITKAFSREDTEIERFKVTNKKFYDVMMRFVKTDAVSSPVMEFIGAIAITAVLFFSGREVILGIWTAGSFFAFFGTAFSIYQPLRNFAQLNPMIQQGLSASERVFALLDEKPTVIEKPSASKLPLFEKEIKFENVSFGYDPQYKVIGNVSFGIKSGEIVALVGPSGSGKTTLAHLLLRFYDTSEGAVYIDGNDIRNVTLKSLHDQMSVVLQETILFNETVKYNIAYGKQDASEQDIINAAIAANAHEFIMKTSRGYDTVVGERGVLLSGGEKQRIAIARAVIRNPRILILDEATSALDAESEKLVQEALEKLMENRTVLLIAHRLATVKKSDRIIVLDKGKIVDIGTHEELFSKEGLYKRLHQLQLI